MPVKKNVTCVEVEVIAPRLSPVLPVESTKSLAATPSRKFSLPAFEIVTVGLLAELAIVDSVEIV